MTELAVRTSPWTPEACALDALRRERTVPFALQRIRTIAAAHGAPTWQELLIRPPGADAGDVVLLAEETGCAQEIDLVIAACGLSALADGNDRISLNVSGQSVSDRDFLARLTRAIETAGFPFSRLVIEITETAPITNPRAAAAFAEAMRELGAAVALDDVTDLRFALPLSLLDVVKVDRSLVTPCAERPLHRARLLAIAEAARGAGILSVAEGIEEPEQLAFVAAIGFTHFQGFLLDRPQPAG